MTINTYVFIRPTIATLCLRLNIEAAMPAFPIDPFHSCPATRESAILAELSKWKGLTHGVVS
jgi:hypothetical protein